MCSVTHQPVQMWYSEHIITVGSFFFLMQIMRETISSCFASDYNIDITVLIYPKLTEVFTNWWTDFCDCWWGLQDHEGNQTMSVNQQTGTSMPAWPLTNSSLSLSHGHVTELRKDRRSDDWIKTFKKKQREQWGVWLERLVCVWSSGKRRFHQLRVCRARLRQPAPGDWQLNRSPDRCSHRSDQSGG